MNVLENRESTRTRPLRGERERECDRFAVVSAPGSMREFTVRRNPGRMHRSRIEKRLHTVHSRLLRNANSSMLTHVVKFTGYAGVIDVLSL